ncbi:MAG: hypothetical protein IJP26_03175 [Clostridia bacterium]|nr:hypothetical protein [Clostridia bacterium]
MAEFCKECYKKVFGDISDDEKIILSLNKDLCEECVQYKRVVVSIVKYSLIGNIITLPFKLIYKLVKFLIK